MKIREHHLSRPVWASLFQSSPYLLHSEERYRRSLQILLSLEWLSSPFLQAVKMSGTYRYGKHYTQSQTRYLCGAIGRVSCVVIYLFTELSHTPWIHLPSSFFTCTIYTVSCQVITSRSWVVNWLMTNRSCQARPSWLPKLGLQEWERQDTERRASLRCPCYHTELRRFLEMETLVSYTSFFNWVRFSQSFLKGLCYTSTAGESRRPNRRFRRIRCR